MEISHRPRTADAQALPAIDAQPAGCGGRAQRVAPAPVHPALARTGAAGRHRQCTGLAAPGGQQPLHRPAAQLPLTCNLDWLDQQLHDNAAWQPHQLGPERQACLQEAVEVLDKALNRLPPNLGQALEQHCICGVGMWSWQACCVSEPNLRKRVQLARRQLRDWLGRCARRVTKAEPLDGRPAPGRAERSEVADRVGGVEDPGATADLVDVAADGEGSARLTDAVARRRHRGAEGPVKKLAPAPGPMAWNGWV